MKNKLMRMFIVVLALGLVAGVSIAKRKGWTLDFKHKGFQHVLVRTAQGPAAYYYVAYEVTNNSGEELTLRPQGKVITETGQTLFAAPAPKAAYIICQKHGRAMLDITDMANEKIPDGETRRGLYIFNGLDDKADSLNVYLYGISNEYQYADEDNRTGYLRKVYHMKLSRPGDANDRHLDPIKVEKEGWTWVPTDVK